jgi:hypothetical protein
MVPSQLRSALALFVPQPVSTSDRSNTVTTPARLMSAAVNVEVAVAVGTGVVVEHSARLFLADRRDRARQWCPK